MTNYDDLFVDEVMRDCWARKAKVSAEIGDWGSYDKRLKEDRVRLEAEGWKFVSTEDIAPSAKSIAHSWE
jgi:hypothetical protein